MATQWTVGTQYKIGDFVTYDSYLYTCINGHKSQSDWMPCIDTASLWQLDESGVIPKPQPVPVPQPAPKPNPVPQPNPPNNTLPMLAPYFYTWGKGNNLYKMNNITDFKNRLKGNSFTLAFVTDKSTGDIISNFGSELKQFVLEGGQPIVSFGGATGTYMEEAVSVDEMIKQISNLIDSTGIRALDFDIEGASLPKQELNNKRAAVITALQKKYKNLYISFTLPADPRGLTQEGINLLKHAIEQKVIISVVNIMAMDIGKLQAGKNWGIVAPEMGEVTVSQLKTLYPSKTSQQLYKMLGITTMIGKNDDDSICYPADMLKIGQFAKEKNIGLLSFWAINRDQTGTGDLVVYSQVNKSDYEFYNNSRNGLGGVLGNLPVFETATPLPIPTPKPTPQNFQRLSTLLKGKAHIGAYVVTWSMPWQSDFNKLELIVKAPVNTVYIAFAQPGCNYKTGSNTFAETGLQFNMDFAVVKDAIKLLRSRGVVVMLSVGGATYPFVNFKPADIASLANDLGCDGVDIDWEDPDGISAAPRLTTIINSMRQALPNGAISLTVLHVGCYGDGNFVNALPPSIYTGVCIPGLQASGNQIDWVNIMSYDAGREYSPTVGFDSYKQYYKGPVNIGESVPPEAWGGNIITLEKVKEHCQHIVKHHANKSLTAVRSDGIFVWNYQKVGTPSCSDIVNIADPILNGISPPNPIPNPQPIQNTWKPNTSYKVDDEITYNNIKYKYVATHVSNASLTPDNNSQIWKKL